MHPTVATRDFPNIDWAAVAARARADLGDERIARFSQRLRAAMTVTAIPVRTGDAWGHGFEERATPDPPA